MKTIDKYKRPIYAEKELSALIECKRRMDMKIFQSSYFLWVSSKWNFMRKFLLEKEIIEKQHTSYIWVGKEPDIKLANEFIKFYKLTTNHENKMKLKTKQTKKESNSNKLYEDYLSLKKKVEELKIQNREMYKELKSVFLQKIEYEKKYKELKQNLNIIINQEIK